MSLHHVAAPDCQLPHGGHMSIRDWPMNERPREKLPANGAHSLSDAELLAVLLGASGRRGRDAGVTTRPRVTGFGNGGQFGTRKSR
jgi:DNA repair protein RadC